MPTVARMNEYDCFSFGGANEKEFNKHVSSFGERREKDLLLNYRLLVGDGAPGVVRLAFLASSAHFRFISCPICTALPGCWAPLAADQVLPGIAPDSSRDILEGPAGETGGLTPELCPRRSSRAEKVFWKVDWPMKGDVEPHRSILMVW
jgi:hypothetical protein